MNYRQRSFLADGVFGIDKEKKIKKKKSEIFQIPTMVDIIEHTQTNFIQIRPISKHIFF